MCASGLHRCSKHSRNPLLVSSYQHTHFLYAVSQVYLKVDANHSGSQPILDGQLEPRTLRSLPNLGQIAARIHVPLSTPLWKLILWTHQLHPKLHFPHWETLHGQTTGRTSPKSSDRIIINLPPGTNQHPDASRSSSRIAIAAAAKAVQLKSLDLHLIGTKTTWSLRGLSPPLILLVTTLCHGVWVGGFRVCWYLTSSWWRPVRLGVET